MITRELSAQHAASMSTFGANKVALYAFQKERLRLGRGDTQPDSWHSTAHDINHEWEFIREQARRGVRRQVERWAGSPEGICERQ
jgi:hypothetical protein